MTKNKIAFYGFWMLLLVLAPITIFLNTPVSYIKLNPATITNLTQRLIGLLVFTMLSVQIILGAYMTKWTEKVGGWVFNFHVFQGILIYLLIIVHITSFVAFNYFIGHGLDPFFAFVDVCVLCDKPIDLYYNFGRLAFWFITMAVLAGYFRAATPFLRLHWRKFHVLNYIAYILIGVHSFLLGSDALSFPFYLIYFGFMATITLVLGYKLIGVTKNIIKLIR